MTTKQSKDYSQGKIYKIEPTCEYEEGDIYIGQTTQHLLCQRMGKHRGQYNEWKNGKRREKTTSFNLFDKYGIDMCKIILIENVNASNYDELASREAYYIRTLKCVNKVIPLRTGVEYYKDNEEKIKEYREKNKEKQKEYYEDNKTELRESHKEYYQNHIDEAREYSQQYYKKNKEILQSQYQEYYTKNKDKKLEYQKKYTEDNQEKIKQYRQKYYQRKKKEKLKNLNNTEIVNI